MKRVLLLSVLLLVSIIGFSQEMVVTTGSLDFLRDKSTAKVEFEYANATWEHDNDLPGFIQTRLEDIEETFVEMFNKKSKTLKFEEKNKDSVKYKMVVHIEKIDGFFGWVTNGFGEMTMNLYGNIEVFNVAEENPICEIRLNRMKGRYDKIFYHRFYEIFEALAMNLVKMGKTK